MTEEITQNREAYVAIVGEPNVGKSTLLNKIVSQRAALATDVPGTTRDRFYAPSSWNGIDFTLIDTAGIIPADMNDERNELEHNVQKQAEIALAQADVVIYVVDSKQPAENVNRNVLKLVRKQKKPVILAVNKCDSPTRIRNGAAEFAFTGIDQIIPCSAVSGGGIGDLLDAVSGSLQKLGFSTAERTVGTVSVSIIGKPNVGKSSLFNTILGEERVVVSPVPGTTRNPTDTLIIYKDHPITLVDTAGLKRKEKLAPLPDIYAAFQTLRMIRRSDICLLVVDAEEGITQQDQRIAAEAVDSKNGLIVVVNKIDLLDEAARTKLEKQIADYFPFLWWAPAVPISAKTGDSVPAILDYILEIEANRKRVIDQEQLTAFFKKKIHQNTPQRIRDERIPKVYSLAQENSNPPTFLMSVNEPSAISMSFRKFVENAIIRELGFWGVPIRLRLEPKPGNPNLQAMNEAPKEVIVEKNDERSDRKKKQ